MVGGLEGWSLLVGWALEEGHGVVVLCCDGRFKACVVAD